MLFKHFLYVCFVIYIVEFRLHVQFFRFFLMIGMCNQKCLETIALEHASNKFDKFQQFEEVQENSYTCAVFVSLSE